MLDNGPNNVGWGCWEMALSGRGRLGCLAKDIALFLRAQVRGDTAAVCGRVARDVGGGPTHTSSRSQ